MDQTELRDTCLQWVRAAASGTVGVSLAESRVRELFDAQLRDDRLQKAIGALLWINEEVRPLVHGLTSRETLRKRFRELPDLIEYLATTPK